MDNFPENRALANKIGLCHIALVVDQVHRKMKVQPAFTAFFRAITGSHAEERARLTYFWWVVLGGKRVHSDDPDLIPKGIRSASTPAFLQDWLAVFPETALPIIGEELTRSWMLKAERLACEAVSRHQDNATELAKAS